MNAIAPIWRASFAPTLLFCLLVAFLGCAADDPQPEPIDGVAGVEDADSISVADAGFETPESALHDPVADVYLVSNINGAPAGKDNNGFISRVSPDGQVLDLRWIAGGVANAVLHAPKGMALKGDSLFVADIDTLRIFHRQTGAPLGARGWEGAGFLNDVASGPDGTLYVTDSGLRGTADGGLEPSGTDAVYRIGADGVAVAIAAGTDLANPNGVTVTEEGVIVVPFGATEVYRLDGAGQRTMVINLPAGQLDGVERLDDGTLLVSSWEGQAVYRVDPSGQVTTEVPDVEAPADIGYDATRRRVLIPLFMANRLEIRTIR